MKRSLLAAVLVCGAGCHGMPRGTETAVAGCPATQVCQQPTAPCLSPAPPCKPPETPENLKAPPAPAAPKSELTETRTTVEALSQDILLVPRTVYVPYAAQSPVAMARMQGIAPAGLRATTVERTNLAEQPKAPKEKQQELAAAKAPAEAPTCNANAEILQCLRSLNQRLDALEQQQRERMCASPGPGLPPECLAPPAATPAPAMAPSAATPAPCTNFGGWRRRASGIQE